MGNMRDDSAEILFFLFFFFFFCWRPLWAVLAWAWVRTWKIPQPSEHTQYCPLKIVRYYKRFCFLTVFTCQCVQTKWDERSDVFSVLMKSSKTHKRLKERFLIGQNKTKRAHFWRSPLFRATYNRKAEKQTVNSTYLVSVGCGRLAERKWYKTDRRDKEKGVT